MNIMNFKPLFFILISLLCVRNCFSQNKIDFELHGTIIIAAIGSDGIVMAADSRTAIPGKLGNVIAFIDSVPKLFPLNKYVYASLLE